MTFKTFVEDVVGVLNSYVVPIIIALIFLFFVWGIAKSFILDGSDQARAQGRQFVLWGIIAIAVLLGVWGIVNMLLSTLNLPNA
jgi:hypothetical protein